MIVLRHLVGDVLRRQRQGQGRTLREVSSAARVSLGYLSEVERGQKEASSELLGAICTALEVPLSRLLREVSDEMAVAEAVEAIATPADVAVPGRRVLEPVAHRPAGLPLPALAPATRGHGAQAFPGPGTEAFPARKAEAFPGATDGEARRPLDSELHVAHAAA
jgi:transcriptional regulator with XRE-family HTH domain